ncbi:MAG TPA: FecR domain-containing protein [Polyangia bacterium]|nr:FecR domain-containing protein [Polyangia bacterium]
MTPSCTRASRLSLASVGGHASEAERLELEAHLATCARCSAAHAELAPVRALRAAEPDGLSSSARERVRRAALAGATRAPASAPRRWGPVGVGGALALASIAALLFLGRPAADGPRVVSGDVAIARGSGAGPEGVVVTSARGGEVRLGDAETALARETSLVWRRDARSVELRAGSVTIDVEHRAGQHFQVRTPRFLVEVIGTRFTVDLAGVRTERGTVRVFAADGTPLGYVAAGQSWTLPAPAAPAPAEAPPAPAAVTPRPVPAAAPSSPVAAPARTFADDGPSARLGQARRALARGNAGEARRLVEPIFHLGRELAVEARVIYAESFLTEGRYTDAVDGYETVVRDFPRTAQAESALYAVAQLESEHGRQAEARAGLARYLAHYPHGRFAREANDRLTGLTAPAQ